MISKIKKLLVLMLVAGIVVGGLAGCKQKSDHPTGDHPSKEAPSDDHPSGEHPG